MTIKIEKKHAHSLAFAIFTDIADYIESNNDKYVEWLKTQTDSECLNELAKIKAAKDKLTA